MVKTIPSNRIGLKPARSLLPAVLGQDVGDQGVGVAVAKAVLGLEQGDPFHVPGRSGGADDGDPVGDRPAVGLFDGGESGGGASDFFGHGRLRS